MPHNHIFQAIRSTGPAPQGLNLNWPTGRFVNFGNGITVDIYGLLLEKIATPIFADANRMETLLMYRANDKAKQKAAFYAISYNRVLAARDLKSPWEGLKVLIKYLPGRC